MQTISKQQLIAINVLVNKMHIDKETKAIMVQGFTGGRANSSKDLLLNEATEMIKHLKSLDPDEKSAEKMRRNIIAMAHEIGWEVAGGKADMPRINGWCKKYGGKNKELNAYTLQELPNLVTAFKKVYLHILSKG